MRSILLISLLGLVGCGSQGSPGIAGPSGLQQIASVLSCSATLSGYTGGYAPLNGIQLTYSVQTLTSGDISVQASVNTNAGQTSSNAVYSVKQGQASNGFIQVFKSVAGSTSSASWNFTSNMGNLTSVTYADASLSPGQTSLNIPCTKLTF